MSNAPSTELMQVAALLRVSLATCILPWFGKLDDADIGEKGPQDFVTIADTTAETFLSQRLCAMRLGSRVVGEEAAAADESVMSRLADGACWIIDPVDGTLLFKNNQPRFGTLVSRSQDGRTEAGWILDTFASEAGLGHTITMGDLASGVWHSPREGEAFHRVPDFAARTTTEDRPEGMLDTRGFSAGFLQPDLVARIAEQRTRFAWHYDLYSAVSIYNSVIIGDAQVFIGAPSAPWDHAAGAFMIEQLGGVSLHLNDETIYRPTRYTTGVVAARSRQVLDAALAETLLPVEGRIGREPDVRKAP